MSESLRDIRLLPLDIDQRGQVREKTPEGLASIMMLMAVDQITEYVPGYVVKRIADEETARAVFLEILEFHAETGRVGESERELISERISERATALVWAGWYVQEPYETADDKYHLYGYGIVPAKTKREVAVEAMRAELEALLQDDTEDGEDEYKAYRVQCLQADLFAHDAVQEAIRLADENGRDAEVYLPENPYERGLI